MECIEIREWIDLGIKFAGGIVAVLVARKGLKEYRENRELRAQDFRWKQTKAAKELSDEMLDDEESKNATLMLDSKSRDYTFNGETFRIDIKVVKKALRIDNNHPNKEERYIRDAFDSLFYYTEKIEQFLQNGLFTLDDIRFPLEYYLNMIGTQGLWPEVSDYLRLCNFNQTIGLIKRFDLKNAPGL